MDDLFQEAVGATDTTWGTVEDFWELRRDLFCTAWWDVGGRIGPGLHASARVMVDRACPQVGPFTSVDDLGSWWRLLNEHLHGRSAPARLFPSIEVIEDLVISGERLAARDASLDTTAPYAGGFMVDLSAHKLGGTWSPRSLAHHGGGGSVIGICDPDRDAVAVVFVSRFWLDPDHRRAYFDQLGRCLAGDLDG